MVDEDDDLELDVNSKDSGNSKNMILIGIIGVLLVVISIGGTLLFVGGGSSSPEQAPVAEDANVETEPVATKNAYYFDIRPSFVVNYHTKGRIRYLQIHVEVMARSEDVIEELQRHLPLVKNNLVALFSSQDFSELQTYEGKEKLRESALEELQRIMIDNTGESGVEAVLFTSFVIQ